MRNREVISVFLKRSPQISSINSTCSLRVLNLKLYTYNTILAQWKNGNLFVNRTRYSVTSSRHCYDLLYLIPKYRNYKVFIMDNVPINTSELIYDN